MTANGYRSKIGGSVHEMMTDAHDAGVVSREALQSIDETCLAAATAPEVKTSPLRERK